MTSALGPDKSLDASVATRQRIIGIVGAGTRGAKPPIAGVHATVEALVLQDDLEQLRQVLLLVVGESGHHRVMVLACCLSNLAKRLFAVRREMKRVEPAIAIGGAALEQVALLQFVENADKAAGVHVEGLRQVLLGDAGILGEDAQDPRMMGREAEGLKALREFRGRVAT